MTEPHSDVQGVFVYGTLKPGLHNYYVAQKAGAIDYQAGYIEGFELYSLEPENYPAIVAGKGRVYGGVLRFADLNHAFKLLDELEGTTDIPPLYSRQFVLVRPLGVTAWVYTYNLSLEREGAIRVPSGEWLPASGEPRTRKF